MPKFVKGDQAAILHSRHLYGYTEIEAGTVVTILGYLGEGMYSVNYEQEEGVDWGLVMFGDEMEKIT